MATVIAEWTPNDPSEGVTHYNMILDGAVVDMTPMSSFSFLNIAKGSPHTYGVQAQNDDPAPDNVSDVAAVTFTVPRGKPSKPAAFTVHL